MSISPIALVGRSVREVRDGDKALMARFEYGPYGGLRLAAGVSSAFGYTGMRQSGQTGQYKFPLRDYDPDLARWTTRDPLGMADGPNMHGYRH